jgi:hypothetical protein
MAEDLEDELTETRYQTKMLPKLLRDLFGDALLSSPGLTRQGSELIDITATPRLFDGSAEMPGGGPIERPLPPLPSVEVRIERGNWRRAVSGAAAFSATAVLAALLFARGGGGRSHATTLGDRQRATPAATVVPAPPGPPVVEPLIDPAPAAAPAIAASASPPGVTGAAKSDDAIPARRPPRSRSHGGPGRIARGLSIDPFAEAATRRGR